MQAWGTREGSCWQSCVLDSGLRVKKDIYRPVPIDRCIRGLKPPESGQERKGDVFAVCRAGGGGLALSGRVRQNPVCRLWAGVWGLQCKRMPDRLMPDHEGSRSCSSFVPQRMDSGEEMI